MPSFLTINTKGIKQDRKLRENTTFGKFRKLRSPIYEILLPPIFSFPDDLPPVEGCFNSNKKLLSEETQRLEIKSIMHLKFLISTPIKIELKTFFPRVSVRFLNFSCIPYRVICRMSACNFAEPDNNGKIITIDVR